MNLPDIVWNGQVYKKLYGSTQVRNGTNMDINEILKRFNELKATDLLDFLTVVAAEEAKKTKDFSSVRYAIRAVLKGYENKEIVSVVESLVKRGRLTLPAEFQEKDTQTDEDSARTHSFQVKLVNKTVNLIAPQFPIHNKVRVGVDDEILAEKVRQLIISGTSEFVES